MEATSVNGAPGSPAPAELGKPSYAWTSSAFYRCLMLDEEALLACREALRSAVEFGTILAWFYVADRTSLVAPGTKVGGRAHAAQAGWRRADTHAWPGLGACRRAPALPATF